MPGPYTNLTALALANGLENAYIANPNANQIAAQGFNSGNIAVATKVMSFLIGQACTIVDVRAYLDTAPTTQSAIIDVLQNGTTIFTTQANRPTIAAGQNASSTMLPDMVSLNAGDRLTVNVAQIGSGTVGAGLYVAITAKTALRS